MKLAKYEHACLVLEQDGKRLVIDPGIFSTSLPELEDVVGVVVTHMHQDHFDLNRLKTIFQKHPNAQFYTVEAVANELNGELKPHVVTGGMKANCAPFELNFFGGRHAIIHTSYPTTDNVGVLVNDTLYYPGDSFAMPEGVAVPVLAVPASAPWMRVGEAMDFITAVKPKRAFPTHNAILSEVGAAIHYRLLESAATAAGAKFEFLPPLGETDM